MKSYLAKRKRVFFLCSVAASLLRFAFDVDEAVLGDLGVLERVGKRFDNAELGTENAERKTKLTQRMPSCLFSVAACPPCEVLFHWGLLRFALTWMRLPLATLACLSEHSERA